MDQGTQPSDALQGAGEARPRGVTLGSWADPAVLVVETVGGETRVYVDALVVARFAEGDTGARNGAIVGLAEGGSFSAEAIAAAFGVTAGRVSQLRKRFREGGAAKLSARSGAPRGFRKLSAKQVERVRELRRTGLSIDEILACVSSRTFRVSRATVGRIVKGIKPRVTTDLPFAATVSNQTPVEPREVSDTPATDEQSSTAQPTEVAAESVDGVALVAEVAVEAGGEQVAEVAIGAGGEQVVEVAVEAGGEQVVEVAVEFSTEEKEAVEGIWRPCAVAGAMVAHTAFEALGVCPALAASGARLRPARTFDLTRIAYVILFGVLLRFRSIESLRDLVRDDFGALLGIDRAPEIRTIRRKLAEIKSPSSGFDGAAFMRSLATSLLKDAAAPEDIYFFDDHFAPYHGKRPFAKGWDAKRRLGAPGREDVYVHDLKGRAVLFVPLEAPTSLSQALPQALAELRAIDAVPRLAVFDRGGWSRDLFQALLKPADGGARVDFLTYLTARNKPRELPMTDFHVEYVTEGGRRHSYRIAERELKLKNLDTPLRIIISYDAKRQKQIPILTSDPKLRASRAVHLLRKRWRQENSFKYLVGELAIDAMISRDVHLEPDHRAIVNPEHAEIKRELDEARRDLASADRDVAQALAENREANRRSVRGFKIANAKLLRQRDEAAERVANIEEDLAATPAKVRRSSVDPRARVAREVPRARQLVNGLKIAVHNAEKWLAERMGPGTYGRFALPILRALFQQPGRIRIDPDRVIVEIQPLDTPRYQRCVELLLTKLNERRATFLDSGLPIEFRLPTAP